MLWRNWDMSIRTVAGLLITRWFRWRLHEVSMRFLWGVPKHLIPSEADNHRLSSAIARVCDEICEIARFGGVILKLSDSDNLFRIILLGRFGFSLGLHYLWDYVSKILSFGFSQINLENLSLNRIFAPALMIHYIFYECYYTESPDGTDCIRVVRKQLAA